MWLLAEMHAIVRIDINGGLEKFKLGSHDECIIINKQKQAQNRPKSTKIARKFWAVFVATKGHRDFIERNKCRQLYTFLSQTSSYRAFVEGLDSNRTDHGPMDCNIG